MARKKTNKFLSHLMRIFASIGSIYLAIIMENMLNRIIPNLGFAFPIIVMSICFGWWTWVLIGRVATWGRFCTWIKAISVFLVVVATWLSMPLYIDYFPEQDTIEFEKPYFDSTQVLVRYGTRANDFFWTQKTIGELKQKSNVALNINGQDIFKIHTDGKQVLVDAILFAGYGEQTVPDYTTIGSFTNFSIQMSGYFVTDETAVGKNFSRKVQATVIKNKALAPPVTITDNAFDWEPKGWRIWKSSTGFEVINENNIPVLVLEYKSPYEITISGLFLTSFGILKVDNSEDVIFEFGDSPFELGTYTVDRIRPRSVFDLFRPERTYILSDKGR